MKRLKKITHTYVIAFMLTLPSLSLAASLSGFQVISEIEINTGYILILGQDGDWNNADGCLHPNRLVVNTANPYYSEIYAMVVASYLQGKQIQAYTEGCKDILSGNRPTVSSLTSKH